MARRGRGQGPPECAVARHAMGRMSEIHAGRQLDRAGRADGGEAVPRARLIALIEGIFHARTESDRMRRQPGDVPAPRSTRVQAGNFRVLALSAYCLAGLCGWPRPGASGRATTGIPFGAQVDQPGGGHGRPSVQQPGAGPCVDRLEISRSARQAQSRCHHAGDVPFKATIALFSVGRISVAAVVLDGTRTGGLE